LEDANYGSVCKMVTLGASWDVVTTMLEMRLYKARDLYSLHRAGSSPADCQYLERNYYE
jgi:hypothetical protein